MRIGIVGCGLIGRKRAQAAVACGHAVTAVVDSCRERAESLAAEMAAMFGSTCDAQFFDQVDVVVVATTHEYLAPLALAAVSAGKHVLLEKPGARSAEELEPVLRAAQANGRLVKVGFNHRFHPALQRAKQQVDEGALGELLYIRGQYGHGGRVGYDQEWRFDRDQSGGGQLIDQGAHLVDLSRWFLGDLSLDYVHLPTYYWNSSVEDNCFIALKTSTQQMTWLHATWTEWKNQFTFEIVGKNGKLLINGLGGSYGTERLTHYRMTPEMGPPETTAWEFPRGDDSWKVEFVEFMTAIEQNRQPCGNIMDAYAMLTLIDQAYTQEPA